MILPMVPVPRDVTRSSLGRWARKSKSGSCSGAGLSSPGFATVKKCRPYGGTEAFNSSPSSGEAARLRTRGTAGSLLSTARRQRCATSSASYAELGSIRLLQEERPVASGVVSHSRAARST